MIGGDMVSDDAFLGGKLHIWQPVDGYRAATDPVLLAACCPARPGESVLDLGCGVGTAAFCLASRVAGLALSGLELQTDYADLARRNAARLGKDLDIIQGSVTAMPDALKRGFDHVITNPPYFSSSGTPARDAGRDTALREEVSLADWILAAGRRLAPGGWLTMILRTDRLDHAVQAFGTQLGSIKILPLAPRAGREAGRVVIRARKGGRAALRLLPPFVLHDGAAHPGDRENHTPDAAAVFRNGAGLCHLFD